MTSAAPLHAAPSPFRRGGRGERASWPMLRIKRVYDPPSADDGVRVLVDRLWPRGLSKQAARVDQWARDVAPSDALRKWFAHDPARWPEFQRRYATDLGANPDAWAAILQQSRQGTVTLLYSARDTEHNNAVALKAYLEAAMRQSS